MLKYVTVLVVLWVGCVNSQALVSRVHLVDHDIYMMNIVQEIVDTLEERGWWNLKLPDVTREFNETVLAQDYVGTVSLRNGFVVSIQNLNVRRDSLNQAWLRVVEGPRVLLRAQLRMEDVTLGYDVEAVWEHKKHRYTGVVTHELLTFDFSITRFPITQNTILEVTPANLHTPRTAIMTFLPKDEFSDTLTHLIGTTITENGQKTWATEVFDTIFRDIFNRIPFPRYCYNCPTQGINV